MWLKSPYLGIIHDIAITQKYVLIPVIARTTSLERLKSGEPMWEWKGDLPTMVGVLPRERRCEGRALVQGPVAQHAALPECHAIAAARSRWSCRCRAASAIPSQIRRWTFDLKLEEGRRSRKTWSRRTTGILPRMDDRFLSLDYRYAYVGSRDTSRPPDTKRAPGIGPVHART